MTEYDSTALLPMTDENGNGSSENPPQPQQANGILVHRVITDDGQIAVAIEPVGEATIDQAPTLLECGLREIRKHLGLAE
jgi:hypothetical protein